jgi:hypothetical protein
VKGRRGGWTEPNGCGGGREPQGDKPKNGGATSLESRMRQKVPVRFGNRWLEKYCPAILQEGLCLKKAENITA